MQVDKVQSNLCFNGCNRFRGYEIAKKQITKMADNIGLKGKERLQYVQEKMVKQQQTNFLHIIG